MLRDNELLNGIYSSSYIYSLLKSEYDQNDKLDLQRVMTFKMASLFYLILKIKGC